MAGMGSPLTLVPEYIRGLGSPTARTHVTIHHPSCGKESAHQKRFGDIQIEESIIFNTYNTVGQRPEPTISKETCIYLVYKEIQRRQ